MSLLPRYLVTLLLCYLVSLLPCVSVTLLPCYFVTLLPCYSVTSLPCYLVTLLPCYLVTFTFLPCHRVTLLPCCLVPNVEWNGRKPVIKPKWKKVFGCRAQPRGLIKPGLDHCYLRIFSQNRWSMVFDVIGMISAQIRWQHRCWSLCKLWKHRLDFFQREFHLRECMGSSSPTSPELPPPPPPPHCAFNESTKLKHVDNQS